MANNITKIVAGVLIAIAVLLSIFAWFLGRRPTHVESPSMAQAVTAKTFPMVVALQRLPAGQPIPRESLKVQQVSALPPGAFADPSMVVGRVPANDIDAQAPVLDSVLTTGLADVVTPGDRAVAIKVDATNAVGNHIRPGNFVDIFLNLKREGAGGPGAGTEIPRTQARLLLSRVRVLWFGDATPMHDITNNNGMGGVRTAVLSIPTDQVDALTLAEASGHLTLALRNPRDDDVATQTVATRGGAAKDPSDQAAAGLALVELSGGSSGPAQRQTAAPRVRRGNGGGSIEVIRGGRAETVAY